MLNKLSVVSMLHFNGPFVDTCFKNSIDEEAPVVFIWVVLEKAFKFSRSREWIAARRLIISTISPFYCLRPPKNNLAYAFWRRHVSVNFACLGNIAGKQRIL